MRVAAALAAASLTLAAASVTACSAGPAPTWASAGTTGGGATSAAAAGNAGSSGTVKNFDVCTALSAAAVSQITGTTFTTTKPNSVENQIFGCDYSTGDSALLQVSVTTEGGKIGYDSDLSTLKTAGFPPNSVTGVGDEAFSAPDPKGNAASVGASSFASYGALFGDVYIQIGGLTYVTPDQGKQIVEELHSKL
jgi:hypothetical protein